jgi:RNA polymerase sigma factor (TIGR02999 family)
MPGFQVIMSSEDEITSLLVAWGEGDRTSLEQLVPLVELELRRLAHAFMRREAGEHTLQTTALINEAYLKLMDTGHPRWQNRAQFYGVAAMIMRRILINYARDRAAQKRGGWDANPEPLPEEIMSPEKSVELIALDDALNHLAKFDRLKARIVELKFFGGMTADEIAEVLDIATPTVNLHWRLAKAWLGREIKGQTLGKRL